MVRSIRTALTFLTASIVALAVILLAAGSALGETVAPKPHYVGTQVCATCHENEERALLLLNLWG